MMEGSNIHPLKVFDLAKRDHRFLYVSAPMVRYSKLAFRQTVYEYGTDITWTPMIIAKEFNRSNFARDSDLTISTDGLQPPTIVQFGGNSPLEIARASCLAAPAVNGVDLNCGCPQSWACSECIGAALMEKREIVRDVVLETREHLARDGWAVGKERSTDDPKGRSVSVKIRVHKDLRKTMDFLTTVIGPENDRHIDFLTIHPRTRSTRSTIPIDLEALEILTSTFGDKLPILVSGDVFDLNALPFSSSALRSTISTIDVPKSILATNRGAVPEESTTQEQRIKVNLPKLAGLMSARGILANPALFAGYEACPWEAVETFINKVIRAPLPFRLTQHHINEMCSPGFGPNKTSLLDKTERAAMLTLTNTVDLVDFLEEKFSEKTGLPGFRRK